MNFQNITKVQLASFNVIQDNYGIMFRKMLIVDEKVSIKLEIPTMLIGTAWGLGSPTRIHTVVFTITMSIVINTGRVGSVTSTLRIQVNIGVQIG